MSSLHNEHKARVMLADLKKISSRLYLLQSWCEDMFEDGIEPSWDTFKGDADVVRSMIGDYGYLSICNEVDNIMEIAMAIERAIRSFHCDTL